jgi:hypothetical protein
MNTIKNITGNFGFFKLLIISIAFIGMQSCRSDKKKEIKEEVEVKKDNAIEIITENMDFQMVDSISSGWNTIRYKNQSNQTHFVLFDKYPEGKYFKDTKAEVLPPFDNGMKLINEGKSEEGFEEFNKLPEWFFEIVFMGGTGLVSPGQIAETTLKLDPGYYLVECYVKMPSGEFHSSNGMARPLIVTDINSGYTALTADINITISSTEGIVYNDTINRGKQIFSVYFKDQIAHENFVGHDVSLVRLNQDADLEALEKWMNWSDPKGLIEPAPKDVTFLGGVNDMPAGSTGYFTATLEPGGYALISEVPNALSKKMLKTFVVSE